MDVGRVLEVDQIMAATEAFQGDLCPLGLPEILTAAHVVGWDVTWLLASSWLQRPYLAKLVEVAESDEDYEARVPLS